MEILSFAKVPGKTARGEKLFASTASDPRRGHDGALRRRKGRNWGTSASALVGHLTGI